MGRLACVDVPTFPLQLLLRKHPEWNGKPAVVVDRDHPNGLLLHVNERAFRGGIRLGMRYGVALELDRELRAGEVPQADVDKAVLEILTALRGASPHVEPADQEPGVFWLDASGLIHLYPSLDEWAERVWTILHELGFAAAVVCGFRRFGTYAVAKSYVGHGIVVFPTAPDEARAAERVALRHLALPADTHAFLDRLKVLTVRDFMRLPEAGILRRFGAEAHRMHRMAHGVGWETLVPVTPTQDPTVHLVLDDPESNEERLLFRIKQELRPLLLQHVTRGQALRRLMLELRHTHHAPTHLSVEPAVPTLDEAQITGLLHLRLESMPLAAPVIELVLTTLGATATTEQLRLFAEKPKRDPDAAQRAFARLRSLFGERAVVHAALEQGHTPETAFSWKPLEKLDEPHPVPTAQPTVVRRVFAKPIRLPPTPRASSEGWLIGGIDRGPVVHMAGPYVLNGGWWGPEYQRDYYFTQLHSGEWLWVYYDRAQRRWFLHGEVS